MIKVVCPHCKESINIVEEGYLEYNLNEKTIYFKCPKCKKTDRTKLYREDAPYPGMKRV